MTSTHQRVQKSKDDGRDYRANISMTKTVWLCEDVPICNVGCFFFVPQNDDDAVQQEAGHARRQSKHTWFRSSSYATACTRQCRIDAEARVLGRHKLGMNAWSDAPISCEQSTGDVLSGMARGAGEGDLVGLGRIGAVGVDASLEKRDERRCS